MSTGESAAAPGWYHGEGDPPNTQRYWDGIQWVGEPRPVPPPPLAAPAVPPGSMPAPVAAAPAGLSPTFQTSSSEPAIDNLQKMGLVLASPGSRIVARVIDSVIVAVLAIGLFIVFFAAGVGGGASGGLVAWALLAAVGGAAYEVGFVALAGGTPGKLALGIRVATLEGQQPPGWGQAAARWVLNTAQLIPFLGQLAALAIWFVSFILLFSDPLHRTLFDRVGGTVVVKV